MEIMMPHPAPERTSPSIQDFCGDFEQLSVLMERTWALNKSQPLLYTPEVLASYLLSPGANFGLAPTVYKDSRIVACIAGFPRSVLYQGKKVPILVVSFLTVASEYKKRGYAVLLWDELVNRARKAGFAAVVNYCVDGDTMNKIMLGTYQCIRVPAAKIFSIRYLTRLITANRITAESRDPGGDLIERFLCLASAVADHTPLSRLWNRDEAEWQCLRRPNSITVGHSAGQRQGLLTAYHISAADRNRTKCVLVEDVLWGDLKLEERRELVQKLVDRSAFEGARMVVVPLQGYADPAPFIQSRFLRSTRVLNAYMGALSTELMPEPVSSFYIDVF